MSSRRIIAACVMLMALVFAAAVLLSYRPMQEPEKPTRSLPEPCRDMDFEDSAFIVCDIDPSRFAIELRLRDWSGKPYGRLDRLPEDGFAFAMNAGMYHEDFSPVGLYVENGAELAPLNMADAAGNFFMKPNGVFLVDRMGRAGVLETAAYAAAKPDVLFATQSGPMLVIDGQIHPRFEPDGQSRYIRNGVGIDGQGRAVFAISRGDVSLGTFARLFRDALDCRNALFFDGGISALYDGRRYIVGGEHPVGPVVIVRGRDGEGGGIAGP